MRYAIRSSLSYLSRLGDLVGDRLGDRSGDRRGEPGVTGGEARGDAAVAETGEASADPRDKPHSDEPWFKENHNV